MNGKRKGIRLTASGILRHITGTARFRTATALVVLLLYAPTLLAQIPTGNRAADSLFRSDTADTKGIQYRKEAPDSALRTRVFSFHYRPATVKIDRLFHPSITPTGIQFSDPLDAFNGNYYLGKGVIGHPHYSLFPDLGSALALQLQPDPNIGYAKRPQTINLFQTQTPYTVLGYHSSLNHDYVVDVRHTQNIIPGWNASLDYRLISPEGVYTASAAKNHYLDATTNYFSRDSRVQAKGGIVWQSFKIDENGGIADASYFTQQIQSNRAGIPVNLYNSGTVHKELAAFGGASLSLVRQFEHYRFRDSLAARFEGDSVVGFDTITLTDTIPVHQPRCLNAGVFGFDAKYDRRKRVFADSTLWREFSATLFWTNDAYPDHRWRNPLKITAGIQPRLVAAVIESDTMRLRSFLDPFARARLALGRHTLSGEAELRSTFSNLATPDSRYAVSLNFVLDTARLTAFDIEAVWTTQTPDLRMLHDYLLTDGVSLKPVVSQHFGLAFRHGDAVAVDLKANHLDHNVWYDSLLAVRVGSSDLWLYQARITLKLHWKWFHLDMQQLLQHSSDSLQMPLPLWASKNSLYADLHLFRRAVRMQVGADIRYHTPFFAPSYDPYTGLFVHQDQQRIGGYIWADAFVNLQVKRACFYLKGGHINALWDNAPNYFILPRYPGQKFGLFWGITWHFFD